MTKHFMKGDLEVLCPLEFHFKEGHGRFKKLGLRKMARLLADSGLPDEARAPLLDAELAMSRALAVEARVPEPGVLGDMMSPPLAAVWGAPVAVLHDFVSQPGADGRALTQAMEGLLNIQDDCPF